MSKKKKDQIDTPGVDTWRDGYRAGTTESLSWAAKKAGELAAMAKTEDGRRAMEFMAQAIEKERAHRYPPKADA